MSKYDGVLTLTFIVLSIAGPVTCRGQITPSTPAPGPSAPSGNGESFKVQGKVYCDPCRIQFPTKISYPIPNAKVILACRERENAGETYTMEGTSDANGIYTITADGDHEEEICDVRVTESPDKKCPEIMEDERSARVPLTDRNGVRGNTRMANPIGFMVKDVDPRCKEILAEIGIMGI